MAPGVGESELQRVLRAAEDRSAPFPNRPGEGVAVAELVALADGGRTAIILERDPLGGGAPVATRARSTVDLHELDLGREVVVAFENGDRHLPIVTGVLGRADGGLVGAAQVEVSADGTRFVIDATQEIVLRCGAASITLTHSGKVLIEGTSVQSRATGTNRLIGGMVELN